MLFSIFFIYQCLLAQSSLSVMAPVLNMFIYIYTDFTLRHLYVHIDIP